MPLDYAKYARYIHPENLDENAPDWEEKQMPGRCISIRLNPQCPSRNILSVWLNFLRLQAYPRIFSFIKAHALLNCFKREKLSDDTIMANQADIDAGFKLYKGVEQSNEMGLSPYLLKMYDDVFMPILKPYDGVSRDEILKQYYIARHKPMSPEVLRLEIIPQLEAVGLIYQEEGERRKMLVFPTMSHTYNKPIVDAAASATAPCVSLTGG